LFPRRVTVRKQGRSYSYIQLVEGYREAGRVRHRVVANLGREDQLKQSGQLDHLAAAFARLDPPILGARREVGPLLLVKHYLDRLGLAQIVERHLPSHGRAQLTNGEVVTALIANRLASPSPLYDISGWASSAAVHELFGIPAMLLNDDRLGRALDAFAAHAEQVRGAAALAAIERFGVEAGRLHLDLTSLRVSGAYESSSLVAKGWDHQHQTVRQVKVMEASNPAGLSLYVRPERGNASETACVAATLERLAALLGPGLVICADAALGYIRHLCAAERAGLRFVVPLRDDTGFRQLYRDQVGPEALVRLDYFPRRQQHLPASRRTEYRGCLRRFPVEDPASHQPYLFRAAFIWSAEEERTVAEARQRTLDQAEEALRRVQRGIGSYYRSVEQVKNRVAVILAGKTKGLIEVQVAEQGGRPTVRWQRDEHAIAEASASDGIYALATNLSGELTATDVLRIYKEQSLVELRHRDLKSNLRVRPIFLHNDQRIEALVSTVGLALLVFGLIEFELRRALGPQDELRGLLPEGRAARPTARNVLAAFQGFGLTYTSEGPRFDRLTATQRRILELLGIALPWPEQPPGLLGRVSRAGRNP
jgi:hypothetical protein